MVRAKDVDDEHTLGHVLRALERVEAKLEKLADSDLQHKHEIKQIQQELHESIQKLNQRLNPVESWILNIQIGGRFVRWSIGAIIALGGLLSALAIFKEKLW